MVIKQQITYEFNIHSGQVKKNGIILREFEKDVNVMCLLEMEHFLDIFTGTIENDNDLFSARRIMQLAMEGK